MNGSLRLVSMLSLLLAGLAPAHASVRVSGTFNGTPLATCNDATAVSYRMADNRFLFTCEDGIHRECTIDDPGIVYTTGVTPTILIACSNGDATGLIVDATIDGTPQVCPTATNVSYMPSQQRFSWTCVTQNFECFPLAGVSYDIPNQRISLSCAALNPFIFSDSFDGE